VKMTLSLPSTSKDTACLLISGELDQTVLVHDYWSTLTDKDKQELVVAGNIKIDLAQVARADTAGLAWLINVVKDAKVNKVNVSFANVPDKLLNLAQLSGANTILTR